MAMSDGAVLDGLNWIETGPTDAPVVVLVHAVGYDLTFWDRQIEALREQFRVVALDLPGHGLSAGNAANWSFDLGARVVAALMERVGRGAPVHLIGISFGGMVVQATVLARPELVRSLVLLGTAATFAEATRQAFRARAALTRSGGMAAVLPSSLERWFTAKTRAMRPELMDRVSKTLLRDDPEVHAAIWDVIADTFDVAGRLGEIQCPTLVVVGAEDVSTPVAAAEVLRDGIAGAELAVLQGAAHMITVEVPGAVNAVLVPFLATHSPR